MAPVHVPIFHVDAFATRRFAGNPAAVLVLEEFLPDAVLQSLAGENNLSETAFLVPEGGEYRLRWFTPTTEVSLCGHATLASAAVVLGRLEPGRAEVTFRTKSGPLGVRRSGTQYAMELPARPVSRIDPPAGLAKALGAAPTEVWENPYDLLAVFATAREVRTLAPEMSAVASLERPGLIATAPGEPPYDLVSRYFAPAQGIPEDPVTGAAHCALVPYWAERLGRSRLRAYQASRRGGELLGSLEGSRVTLEGACTFYLEGHVEI